MEGGRGYKIHLDRAGSCVQMVEVPSTALDMGNEEHHHGNWRASRDITGMSPVGRVALHNSFNSLALPRIVLSAAVCLRAWDPAKLCVCIVRNVMDNLILGG